jgi:zinc protease
MRAALHLVLAVIVTSLIGCAHLKEVVPPPASTAAVAAPRAAAMLPPPRRHVFPNGVVLIVQEHRASDVVALQLWVKVGGRDEAPDEFGLSHYLEHMLFKGTPTRPPGSIDLMIEGVGGQSNAFTSSDATHFDVVMPADRARAGMELLADIAVNATFDATELEREKQVVFEEMRLTEDDPDRFLARRLAEEAYAGTPYGRPILGTRPLIQALTRERLAAYYRKRYVPSNMTVVVVGAVDPAAVQQMAADTFGKLEGPRAPRDPVPPQPDLTGGRRIDVPRPEKQAFLGMAWKAPAIPEPDVYATDLLSYILGDSPSSRLNVALRERTGLVSSIEALYIPRERAGLLTVTAVLEPANLDRAEAAILDVIRRVQTEGVTDAERARAIVTAESSYAFDIETAEGLAKVYGQAESTWTLQDELQYLERLRKITSEQIQAAARKYLPLADYVRVQFRPGS